MWFKQCHTTPISIGLYNLFMVIRGMVYYCFNHITPCNFDPIYKQLSQLWGPKTWTNALTTICRFGKYVRIINEIITNTGNTLMFIFTHIWHMFGYRKSKNGFRLAMELSQRWATERTNPWTQLQTSSIIMTNLNIVFKAHIALPGPMFNLPKTRSLFIIRFLKHTDPAILPQKPTYACCRWSWVPATAGKGFFSARKDLNGLVQRCKNEGHLEGNCLQFTKRKKKLVVKCVYLKGWETTENNFPYESNTWSWKSTAIWFDNSL